MTNDTCGIARTLTKKNSNQRVSQWRRVECRCGVAAPRVLADGGAGRGVALQHPLGYAEPEDRGTAQLALAAVQVARLSSYALSAASLRSRHTLHTSPTPSTSVSQNSGSHATPHQCSGRRRRNRYTSPYDVDAKASWLPSEE